MGVYLYLAWFLMLFTSVVVAVVSVVRRGMGGLGFGFAAFFGAVLMWAFVSAGIGLVEQRDYAQSGEFWLATFIGVVGLSCFGAGCLGLRSAPRPRGMT